MSAFWKKNKDSKEEEVVDVDSQGKSEKKEKKVASQDKKTKKSTKKVKGNKKDKGLVVPEEKAGLINKVLIKPMISEAVMRAQELGKYTFKVVKSASKKEISLAVSSLYKVTVKKVNVVNYGAQDKMFRGKKGNVKGYKKAIVTLKKGDKIKLF